MLSVARWLDERLRIRALRDFLAHKMVPIHQHSIWYYFGGVTFFLFSIQVVTGVLLLLYYRPAPESAFESVRFIVAHVPFGWLVRSIHAWAANLMVAAAFIHFFSVFFMRAYRKPRELTWLTGCVLLAITLAFGFSGYLLPWNELAFFATKVGTDIIGAVPAVGHEIRTVLRGGEEVTGATLTRMFGIHVALLPLLTAGMVLVHLALVQLHGMSSPESAKGKKPRHMPFYPHFMLREAMVWLGALAVLIGLATILPWELGREADPFAPAPEGIRPEWYFSFMSQSLKYLPPQIFGIEGEKVGILGFAAIFGLLFVAPFFDRGQSRAVAVFFTLVGVGLMALMAVMTVLAYVKPY
jgi:cytochrome b6